MTAMLECGLCGQVAEIVQHPETMIEEMERYNRAIGGTLSALLGQDEPDGS